VVSFSSCENFRGKQRLVPHAVESTLRFLSPCENGQSHVLGMNTVFQSVGDYERRTVMEQILDRDAILTVVLGLPG
jgi:hypothetical protein